MRCLVLAAVLVLLANTVVAQELKSFTIPAATMNHIVMFLRNGGTIAEGSALADQLVELAQQQLAAQSKAPPDSTLPKSEAAPTTIPSPVK
jgi:hypothetical protein